MVFSTLGWGFNLKYTICVDFDGTIVDHAFPEIGILKPGVREALEKLSEHFTIVISSCRTSQLFKKEKPEICIPDQLNACGRDYAGEMRAFLDEHKIPYDRIDMGDEGKVVAIAYIDDRAYRFENNWEQLCKQLLA